MVEGFWKRLRYRLVKMYLKLLGVRFFRIDEPNENKIVDMIEIIAINEKKATFTVYEYNLKDMLYTYRGFREEITRCYLVKMTIDKELSDDLYLFNNMKLVIRSESFFMHRNRDVISPILVEIFIDYIKEYFKQKKMQIHVQQNYTEKD